MEFIIDVVENLIYTQDSYDKKRTAAIHHTTAHSGCANADSNRDGPAIATKR